MSDIPELANICRAIVDNCAGCGQCIAECRLLQETGEDMTGLAERRPTVFEAYSCSLCGLCTAVCPQRLPVKEMFALRRAQAVAHQEIDIEEFRYLFPDRKANAMKVYREVKGIDYKGLKTDEESDAAFFPGCTLLTYDPQLTAAVFGALQYPYPELTLLTDCCGLPLFQLGLYKRSENYAHNLKQKLRQLKIRTLIVACPNCLYRLQPALAGNDIELVTVFEALNDSPVFNTRHPGRKVVAVHDSCPDRFQLRFACQAREALVKKGYQLVEMEHHQGRSLCCGSGGQVTHTRPDLADGMTKTRINEARASGAQILAAYCLGCVLNLSKDQRDIPVQHVLNLLLDYEQDFFGLKTKTKAVFEGPEGRKLWQRVLED